ncbi:hypothetical protein REPUB_Repub05bG0003600 [Reevesia pubescens]
MDKDELVRLNRHMRMWFLKNCGSGDSNHRTISEPRTSSAINHHIYDRQQNHGGFKCFMIGKSITLHSTVDHEGNLMTVKPVSVDSSFDAHEFSSSPAGVSNFVDGVATTSAIPNSDVELLLIPNDSEMFQQGSIFDHSMDHDVLQRNGSKDDFPFACSSSSQTNVVTNTSSNGRFSTPINLGGFDCVCHFCGASGKVDHDINVKHGPYVFKIGGQVHHRIGSLLPYVSQCPKFAQLYICDTDNEVSNRITSFDARDRFTEDEYMTIQLRLIRVRDRDERQYDAPRASEIARLIVGEDEFNQNDHNIIIEHQYDGLKRINELHPSFMAMQYPLLFPFGEDGFKLGIKYRDSGCQSNLEQETVTIMEYYAFLIQHQLSTGHTLLRGGRLF